MDAQDFFEVLKERRWQSRWQGGTVHGPRWELWVLGNLPARAWEHVNETGFRPFWHAVWRGVSDVRHVVALSDPVAVFFGLAAYPEYAKVDGWLNDYLRQAPHERSVFLAFLGQLGRVETVEEAHEVANSVEFFQKFL